MKTLKDSLYIAWIIGTKDILDALKNKSSRSNIIIMVGMVVVFSYFSTLRPFDKNVSVVVYDKGNTNLVLESANLGDGAKYSFREASSLPEMERRMAYQNLGLVLLSGRFGPNPDLQRHTHPERLHLLGQPYESGRIGNKIQPGLH